MHACNMETFNNTMYANSMNAIGPEACMQFSLRCIHVNVCVQFACRCLHIGDNQYVCRMCTECVQHTCSCLQTMLLICMYLLFIIFSTIIINNYAYIIIHNIIAYYSMFFKVRRATEHALLMTTFTAGPDKSAAPLYVL